MDLGSIPEGVRRFESGPPHIYIEREIGMVTYFISLLSLQQAYIALPQAIIISDIAILRLYKNINILPHTSQLFLNFLKIPIPFG